MTMDAKQSLSPEQKKQFDLVSRQALEFLLDDNNAKLIVDKAKQGDPKAAIVDAITPVFQGIWASGQEAGVKLDLPVFLAAAVQVISVLAEMLSLFGVIPKEQIPQFAAETAKQAVQQHNAKFEQQQPKQPGLAGMAGGM